MRKRTSLVLSSLTALALAASYAGCGSSGDTSPPGADGAAGRAGSGGSFDHKGGAGGSAVAGAGGAGVGGVLDPCTNFDDGSKATTPAQLKPFTPPADPGGSGVLFDASGEVLAFGGYAFPPASAADPAFVDGWQITFDELLVTIDNITLSTNPDTDPGDQALTGPAVARVRGPWAVDLHKKGSQPGKGGGDETAVPIAALSRQNLNGNALFDLTARYAFGFDVVVATADAQNVNLNGEALKNYQQMIEKGYAVMYIGTATFKADPAKCTTTDPAYDFGAKNFPTMVKFRLGFKSPTTYVNCQNPDLQGPSANNAEEHPRGVQVFMNSSVIAQVTMHTDHPFWESTRHDSPAHFDPFAAVFAGCDAGKTYTANTELLRGVDFTNFRDGRGAKLPWRDCVSGYFRGYYSFPSDAGKAMHFDPQNVSVDPGNTDGTKLRDYLDYVVYNQSTQGHLNSDGLCFVKRNYPSPP